MMMINRYKITKKKLLQIHKMIKFNIIKTKNRIYSKIKTYINKIMILIIHKIYNKNKNYKSNKIRFHNYKKLKVN